MALQVWFPFNGHLSNQGIFPTSAHSTNATIDENGKFSSCYRFNGANSYIGFSSPLSSNTPEFSISAWVKLEVSGANQTICCMRTATGEGIALFRLAGNKFRFDDGVQTTFDLTHTSSDWFHICVTRKPGEKSLYINGVLKQTVATSGSLNNISSNCVIGASTSDEISYNNYTTGAVCDFKIYDHCLSKKEIKENSKGLMLYLPFRNIFEEEGLKDLSGFKNHFSLLEGSIVLEQEPNSRSSINFNANTYFASLQNVLIPNEHTISAWVKRNANTKHHIIDWRNRVAENGKNAGSFGIQPLYISDAGYLQYFSAEMGDNSSFSYPFQLNQWYHICLVANGTEAKLYVNGVFQQSKPNKLAANTKTQITLGARYSNENLAAENLSNLRIYGTCLSDADVKQLYSTSAELDKNNDLFTYEFKDKESLSNLTNFKKYGIIESRDGCLNVLGSHLAQMELKKLEDGSNWARIYYLDCTSGTFFTSTNALNLTEENRFSLLEFVEDFKMTNGYYEFMLTYPNLSSSLYNRWRQTGSPMESAPGGYERITTAWSTHAGPLRKASGNAQFNCDNVGSTTWFAAIGQTTGWTNNSIPAADGSEQKITELWVRIGDYNGDLQIKKNYILTNDFIEF